MPEEFTPLSLPSLQFVGQSSGMPRMVLDLHGILDYGGAMEVGYEPLPDEFELPPVAWWMQAPFVVPSGFVGRAFLQVDVQHRYLDQAQFTAGVEYAKPRYSKLVSVLELRGGYDKSVAIVPPAIGPIRYRRGDRLVIGVENNGSAATTGFELIPVLLLRSTTGDLRLMNGISYNQPCNGYGINASLKSCRSVVPGAVGNQCRIHVSSRGQARIEHIGIGRRVGSAADMVAPAVPFTFGPSNVEAWDKTGWVHEWSNWIDYSCAGEDVVIDMKTVNGDGRWAYSTYSPFHNWYSLTTASWGSATHNGTVISQPNTTHGFNALQFRTV